MAMARLKPKSAGSVAGLTQDQVWFFHYYGDLGMPAGAPEFPFESWEAARVVWFRHRDDLLRMKFPTSGPLFGETEFDIAYAEEREARRIRLAERERARALRAEGI
jgi:hypothetical protein